MVENLASQRRLAFVLPIVIILIIGVLYLGWVGFTAGSGKQLSSTTFSSSSSSPGSGVLLSIGSPQVNMVTVGDKSSGTTFVGSEVFPVTLTSTTNTRVNLTAQNVPAGIWVHFTPGNLVSSPAGTTSEMTIAGAVRPFSPGLVNSTLTITADYQSGSSTLSLVVVRTNNVTAIHVPSSIDFSSPVVTQTNATAYQVYGVVYDPSSPSLPSQFGVDISVAGLRVGSSIEQLPAGLDLVIPNSTLSLSADNPVYFRIGANATNVSPGTYDIVLKEIADGQSYQVDLQVIVNPQLRSAG